MEDEKSKALKGFKIPKIKPRLQSVVVIPPNSKMKDNSRQRTMRLKQGTGTEVHTAKTIRGLGKESAMPGRRENSKDDRRNTYKLVPDTYLRKRQEKRKASDSRASHRDGFSSHPCS